MTTTPEIVILDRGRTTMLGLHDPDDAEWAAFEPLFGVSPRDAFAMCDVGVKRVRTGGNGVELTSKGDPDMPAMFDLFQGARTPDVWTLSFRSLGISETVSHEVAERLAGSRFVSFPDGVPDDWIDVRVRCLEALADSYRAKADEVDREAAALWATRTQELALGS